MQEMQKRKKGFNMPTMYILRGIPGSGKSTWRESTGLAYINRDELREQNKGATEKQISKLQDDFVRNNIQSGIDFVIDNTHIRSRSYSSYVTLAQQNGYDVEIKEFKTDLITCLLRVSQRERKVPFSIILKMAHDSGWYEQDLKQYFGAERNKRKAIIVDLDGTLCDINHRREHVIQKPKNWKAFFAGISEDKVNRAVYDISQSYYTLGDKVILVSGRGEEYRNETEAWLKKNNVKYHWLLMRPYNNREDDDIIKENIYRTYIEPYFNVLFVLDDRKRVGRMWYRIGLTVFMVGDPDGGDF
jgi:predicted kinase